MWLLSGGGTITILPREAHTGDNAPSNVAGFLEPVLVRNRTRQPRVLIGRLLGHHDADVVTLMQNESVRCNGSWKSNFTQNGGDNEVDLKDAMSKRRKTKLQDARVPGVRTCSYC